jgi:hypothetical protein
VSADAWPFVDHLNGLHRKCVYFDRVWLRLQWLHPFQSGFIRTDELEGLEDEGSADQPVRRVFGFAKSQKIKDDLNLMQYLSDSLACVAPDLFDERCALFGELMDESSDHWVAPSNPNKGGNLTVSGFLFSVEFAHSIFAKRELELAMLREGHHLSLWKADSQKLGARVGGMRSAETRRLNRKVDPVKIVSDAETLVRAGQDRRYVAGIIAARIGVSSDYVRKILRDSKMPN